MKKTISPILVAGLFIFVLLNINTNCVNIAMKMCQNKSKFLKSTQSHVFRKQNILKIVSFPIKNV